MKFIAPDTSLEDYQRRRSAFLKWVIETEPNMKIRCERIESWIDDNSPYSASEKLQNLRRGLFGDERH